jgi:hypothetical protein
MGMRTTREQKEANTVERNMMELNAMELKQWSRPSHSVMSFCLGISYALGTGQVPV